MNSAVIIASNLARNTTKLALRIPGIKFTVSHSSDGIEFLDTFVYMKNNLLHTRPLYRVNFI